MPPDASSVITGLARWGAYFWNPSCLRGVGWGIALLLCWLPPASAHIRLLCIPARRRLSLPSVAGPSDLIPYGTCMRLRLPEKASTVPKTAKESHSKSLADGHVIA
jgi:hypothetical protein